MTVESVYSPITLQYTGPGQYDFNFPIYDDTDLVVTFVNAVGAVSTLSLSNYSVVKNEAPLIGGHITTTTPADTSGSIIIELSIPLTQPTRWSVEGNLNLDKVEKSFDRLVLQMQQAFSIIKESVLQFAWRGTWLTNTAYEIKSIVVAPNGNWYAAISSHTSGVFEDDLSSGLWLIVLDITYFEQLASSTAQAASEATAAAVVCEEAQDVVVPLAATVSSSATQVAINLIASVDAASRAEAAAAEAEAAVAAGVRVDAMTQDSYLASTGQTDFTITQPAPKDNIMVFFNSRKMRVDEDFTLNSDIAASLVHLLAPAELNDEIDIVSFNSVIPSQPLIDYPSVTYDPTWTASVSNPSIGNGSLIGEYSRSGGKASIAVKLTIGSTTTFGSGRWRFGLPIEPDTNTGVAQFLPVLLSQDGITNIIGMAMLGSTVPYFEIYIPNTLEFVESDMPWAWAVGDSITMSFTYVL